IDALRRALSHNAGQMLQRQAESFRVTTQYTARVRGGAKGLRADGASPLSVSVILLDLLGNFQYIIIHWGNSTFSFLQYLRQGLTISATNLWKPPHLYPLP